jgi:hypothetical protein
MVQPLRGGTPADRKPSRILRRRAVAASVTVAIALVWSALLAAPSMPSLSITGAVQHAGGGSAR